MFMKRVSPKWTESLRRFKLGRPEGALPVEWPVTQLESVCLTIPRLRAACETRRLLLELKRVTWAGLA